MSPALLVEFGIVVAGIGLWFVAFWGALLFTRPRPITAAPPTQDFGGAEPPAVVSLITGRWELTEDAAESTLIDLAARRNLEFRQPGNDPLQTTIHVRESRPSGLNRYETMIFERVQRLAVGGSVPLTALTFRDPAEATSWGKRLNAAIVADARSRGLSRRRFSPTVVAALTIVAALPSIAAGLAVYLHSQRDPTSDEGAWIAPIFFVWFALGFLAAKSRGERDTPLGREVAARWLGLKHYLRAHESFADLPPAAVTVWDRYLSYGDAVGATRVCSAVIDLGMGNRRKVWSSFGGAWRRVRVRYPRFFPRYGQKALRLTLKAAGALVVVTFVVRYAHVVKDLAPDPVTTVLQVLVVVALAYAGYTLIGVVVDLAMPVTVRGEVLWVEVWKSGSRNDESVPWLHYVAVDEGREDRTVAWGCPSELAGRTRPGDVVTLTARRWTRRVLTLHVEQHGQARAAAAAADEDTEKLILREMSSGLQGLALATAMHEPEVYPGRMLTTDEVSRVLGAPASLQDTGRAMAVGAMAVAGYQTAHGASLVVTTASGTAASELAIRVHRGGVPVPGVGDEAYTSGAWAVARRGRTVVRLELRTPGQVNQQALTWLLSQAMSRLPQPSAQPL
ncbi:DUF2207 domain-containing protein [Dactylosporangium sp. AC04546]|uniref:DUF2207 family protein n=1 Tax=Dactylosporangium sp. AC04546 TaxID=2862460 RepID=UPI001EDD7DCD|nr:DUF2207 domain-containing protein [Dactylosporangium sp. AC04546]WVK85645.1 DUF2207 domain-containing protein [Dactylosporangium sp. AC04546]